MKLKIITGISFLLCLLVYACQSEGSIEFARYYTGGAVVYQEHCQNCHGTKGEGLGALIPPLTDSVYLKKNLSKLPCLLKNGIKGRLTINNKPFDGQMPATNLTPMEIAQVISYVDNSFGNKLGVVTVDDAGNALAKCK